MVIIHTIDVFKVNEAENDTLAIGMEAWGRTKGWNEQGILKDKGQETRTKNQKKERNGTERSGAERRNQERSRNNNALDRKNRDVTKRIYKWLASREKKTCAETYMHPSTKEKQRRHWRRLRLSSFGPCFSGESSHPWAVQKQGIEPLLLYNTENDNTARERVVKRGIQREQRTRGILKRTNPSRK